MKVTTNGMNVTKIYNENKAAAVHEKEKADKKYDVVEISKEGQEIAKYLSIVREISDTRISRIDEIKDKIQSGKYSVSSEDLAKKILQTIKGENI